MQPELHSLFVSERLKDDHTGLEPVKDGIAHVHAQPITLRPLTAADVPAVERLAALEEQPMPPGPLLLAEVDGTVEAAVAIVGGETVANPFAACAEAVSLLHARVEQLRAA